MNTIFIHFIISFEIEGHQNYFILVHFISIKFHAPVILVELVGI